jgi:hypothetical protein
MGGLIPLAFAAIAAGLVAFAHFGATRDTPMLITMNAAALGQRFMEYRQNVLAFVQDNPGYVGTVQVAQLALPPGLTGASIPAGASNQVVSDGAGGYYIYVWCPGSAATLAQIATATNDDASFGYTVNGDWQTPALGNMGAVPAGVPNGDLFSEIQIGG